MRCVATDYDSTEIPVEQIHRKCANLECTLPLANGKHLCRQCGNAAHPWCGRTVGDEGFGAGMTCFSCLTSDKRDTQGSHAKPVMDSSDEEVPLCVIGFHLD